MQLLEMGVDGQGGNSDPFWMAYPYPFLKFWYEAHPLEKAPAEVVVVEGYPQVDTLPCILDTCSLAVF